MEEVENIKQLLLSDDSKDLGLELAKSLNLVNEVVHSLDIDIKQEMQKNGYWASVESWKCKKQIKYSEDCNGSKIPVFKRIFVECNTIELGFNTITMEYIYHFAKKREDLIKELTK